MGQTGHKFLAGQPGPGLPWGPGLGQLTEAGGAPGSQMELARPAGKLSDTLRQGSPHTVTNSAREGDN
jgi:hypothetical protein